MRNSLRIVAVQVNTTVGDIVGNTKKITESTIYARDRQKANAIVFPEMVLVGYPPEDLLLRQELYDRIKIALKEIQKIKNIYIIFGLPIKDKNQYFNSALVIYNGKILARYDKQLLPNHGVFDEKRYFTAGTKSCVVNIGGVRVALVICEDLWFKKPVFSAKKMGAELIIGINASPFDIKKPFLREQILSCRACESKIPIIYVNSIGAQDELVFDGGSSVISSKGTVIERAPFFNECLMPIDILLTKKKLKFLSKRIIPQYNTVELVYKALVLGVRDYIEKNGFKGAIVGVSGGIDSALVLAIAVDAIGKDRLQAIYLPSRYSSKLSAKISMEASKILGVKYTVVSIESVFKAFLDILPKKWSKEPRSVAIQNLQARCRGTILMAFSNKIGSIVLSTGNKSEMAVGYATLYGDMVGGFCVLKDVSKTLVYQLAEYRNTISYVIPKAAITRAPTAELARNQKDADDLPPYSILDKILHRYIELNQSAKKIVAAGFNKNLIDKVINMVNHNEYKRRQASPGTKITTHAFGRERRYPITSKFD